MVISQILETLVPPHWIWPFQFIPVHFIMLTYLANSRKGLFHVKPEHVQIKNSVAYHQWARKPVGGPHVTRIQGPSYNYCGPGSVVGISTGYGLDGPRIESQWGGAKFSAPVQTGPGAQPASCTMGTGSFTGVKSGRGVTLTPHSLLVPWSRKSRAIPLLPVWAVRPVQSLSACTV